MEQWKSVMGYEGIYEISDRGTVKRVGKAPGAQVGRIMKWSQVSGGYFQVHLSKNGEHRLFLIHRLVAQHFVPNPNPAFRVVHHKDGNKANCSASNLEWTTPKQNIQYALSLGLMAYGERHGLAKLTDKAVLDIRRRYAQGAVTQRALADEFGVVEGTIKFVIDRETWTHI